MKILTDKTYQSLLKQISDNANLADNYLQQRNELANKINGLKNKFHFSRLVLGHKGSGKTLFLNQMIKNIPHHFVICVMDEFPDVAPENKFVMTPNTKTVDEVIDVMVANKDRHIFIDDFWSPMKIIDHLSLPTNDLKINYTITSSRTSMLNEYAEKVDFIYFPK